MVFLLLMDVPNKTRPKIIEIHQPFNTEPNRCIGISRIYQHGVNTKRNNNSIKIHER